MLKKKLTSVKTFVKEHPVATGTIVALTGVVALQHAGIRSLNAFLDEHGLTEAYYCEIEDE